MSKKTFWISFDLGLNGDYENLYRWLDSNNALECGDCLAVIKDFKYEGDFLEYLKNSISKNVEIRENKDRIYVVYKDGEKIKGKFIFGSRKQNPPWKGYALEYVNLDEE